MATANEKLAELRTMVEPAIEELLGNQRGVAGMAVAFLRPQIEALVENELARPAEELDTILAVAIDLLTRVRSDDARRILCWPDGAVYLEGAELLERDGEPVAGELVVTVGDPVRRSDLHHGSDPDGQEHPR